MQEIAAQAEVKKPQYDLGRRLSYSPKVLKTQGLSEEERKLSETLLNRTIGSKPNHHYSRTEIVSSVNFYSIKYEENLPVCTGRQIPTSASNCTSFTSASEVRNFLASDIIAFLELILKNPNSKEFLYLLPRAINGNASKVNPYDLAVVNFSEIDTKSTAGYYTMSAKGIIHTGSDGLGTFMTIEEWLWEYELYYKLQKKKFFADFQRKKCFELWRNTVFHNKIAVARKKLELNAIFLDNALQQTLLEVKKSLEIDIGEKDGNILGKKLLDLALNKALDSKGLRESNSSLTYAEKAERKTELSKVAKFAKLIEFMS